MIKERLDQNDRINLQAGIAKGYSLKFIAEQLKKSRSTIYREIINNCTYKDTLIRKEIRRWIYTIWEKK